MDINQIVRLKYNDWTNRKLEDEDLNKELREIAEEGEAVFDRF